MAKFCLKCGKKHSTKTNYCQECLLEFQKELKDKQNSNGKEKRIINDFTGNDNNTNGIDTIASS